VLDDFADRSLAVVHNLCSSLGIDKQNAAVQEACSELESSKQTMQNLDTIYKRKKWLEKNEYFVEPVQHELGSREVQRFRSSKMEYCSVLEEDSYQLIMLDQLLSKLLENRTLDAMLKPEIRTPNFDCLLDFWDGTFYREHQFFRKFPDALVFHFFY